MKRLLISIFIICFIFSCSLKKRSDGKDIEEISDIDFEKSKIVPYDKKKDYYDMINLFKPVKDSLASETIQRMESSNFRENAVDEVRRPLLVLARLCYEEDFEEASILIDKIYPQYQKHPGYWNQVGNCYFLNNDLIKADIFYKQSLKYNKKYSPSYNNIGNIHIKKNEYEKALAAFEKSHKLNKSSLTPAYNLSQIYLSFGIVNKAQKLLVFINSRRPGDDRVLSALATTHLLKGDIKKSLFYFKKVSSDGVAEPFAGLNYSIAAALLGDKNSAIKIFNKIDNNQVKWRNYYLKVKSFLEKR